MAFTPEELEKYKKVLGLPGEESSSSLLPKDDESKLLSDTFAQPQNEDYLKLLQTEKEKEDARAREGKLVWNPETGTQEFIKSDKPQARISDLWKGATPEERASLQYGTLNRLRGLDKDRDSSVKKSSQLQSLEDIISKVKLPERKISSEVTDKASVEQPIKTQTPTVKKASSTPVSEEITSELDAAAKKPEVDFLSLLEQAKQSRDQQQLFANLGRAGETLSGAIGGMVRGGTVTKPTGTEFYKDLAKQAEKTIEDFETKYKYQKDQDRRDPNSEISKLAKANFKDLFGKEAPENMTAESFEKVMPYYSAKRTQEEAARSRESIASMQAGARADALSKGASEKIQGYLEKEAPKFEQSKIVQLKRKIDTSAAQLDEAIKNPSSIGDITALYSIIKGLDPDSVVREGEIKLIGQGYNVWEKLKLATTNFTDKRVVPDKILGEIKKYLDITKKATDDQYNKAYNMRVNNALKRLSTVKGVADPEAEKEFIRGQLDVLDTRQSPSVEGEASVKKVIKLPKSDQNRPGRPIEIGGKKFIIDANGETATEQ